MSKLTTNQLAIFICSMLIVLFVELTFFKDGSAVLLVLCIVSFYIGYMKKKRYFIWTAIIFLFLSCITLVTVRIFICVLLAYFLYRLAFKPAEIIETKSPTLQGVVYPNKQLGDMHAPLESYQWQDMLIERFIADLTIDTTETILPAGKSILSIHQRFGKARIVVPYEVNIQLHVTALYGEITFQHSAPRRLVNETFVLRDGDDEMKRTLVITIHASFTDIEVVRA